MIRVKIFTNKGSQVSVYATLFRLLSVIKINQKHKDFRKKKGQVQID